MIIVLFKNFAAFIDPQRRLINSHRVFHWLMILPLIVLSTIVSAQTRTGNLQHEADQYFEKGDYRSALMLYKQAGLENSRNKKLRERIAISMYESNDLDGAQRLLIALIREGKTAAPVFFYMAKIYQAKKNFSEAISTYKKYLQRTKENDQHHVWVKDELTRCANGLRFKYADQDAYVENAGPDLNSEASEFGVMFSPTIAGKIYFNSNRDHSTDIYSASLVNGKWSDPRPLPSSVNSKQYDELLAFSDDGQILYFLSPASNSHFTIMTDTFSGEEDKILQGRFNGPYDPRSGDADLKFFNDSVCLFASNRAGGYGGYDLYISVFTHGHWSAPTNLGPAINTFYNERFPFLTRNGMTLFYSSDNLQSVGGYDVFKTNFDPDKLAWSKAENLGFPVNSSLDDTHFIFSQDGISGFVSSNRKSGLGDFDLYRFFYKQPLRAQQFSSHGPTFYHILLNEGKESPALVKTQPSQEIKEYFISHLFFESSGEVLTPQNIKKLDLLSNLMLIYPRIKAELSAFEVPAGQKAYTLYYSIKKAEQAADYLVRKGVDRSRLILKGYGSSFPLAKKLGDSGPSSVFMKLNHRLEINLHDTEDQPVRTFIEVIPVPDNLQDPAGVKFNAMRHGFYFSVQIASVSQILQNPLLESEKEVFIEKNPLQGNYRYMVGMFNGFDEAEKKMKELIGWGLTDAYIVPYLDGVRLDRDEMQAMASQYPEILKYLMKE